MSDELYIQSRKLIKLMIDSKLTGYGLNYDDGTLEGIQLNIFKPIGKTK